MEETFFSYKEIIKYFCLIRGQKTPEDSVAFKASSQKSTSINTDSQGMGGTSLDHSSSEAKTTTLFTLKCYYGNLHQRFKLVTLQHFS